MRYTKPYFSDEELKCKESGGLVLDPVFDLQLAKLRSNFNEPMIVNSCCRSRKHNEAVGGAAKSFHIYDYPAWKRLEGCAAIDIAYKSIFYRNKLARAAWKAGWRIGFNKHFLHIDIAAIAGILPKTVFQYDNVTKEDLLKFKSILTGE